jgi:hypothetical protein
VTSVVSDEVSHAAIAAVVSSADPARLLDGVVTRSRVELTFRAKHGHDLDTMSTQVSQSPHTAR